MKNGKVFIEGTKSERVQVEIRIEDLLGTLKREVYRPLNIDFTAFVDGGEIKIWEDDCRNNWKSEPYKTTSEQRQLIRAFDLIEKALENNSKTT